MSSSGGFFYGMGRGFDQGQTLWDRMQEARLRQAEHEMQKKKAAIEQTVLEAQLKQLQDQQAAQQELLKASQAYAAVPGMVPGAPAPAPVASQNVPILGALAPTTGPAPGSLLGMLARPEPAPMPPVEQAPGGWQGPPVATSPPGGIHPPALQATQQDSILNMLARLKEKNDAYNQFLQEEAGTPRSVENPARANLLDTLRQKAGEYALRGGNISVLQGPGMKLEPTVPVLGRMKRDFPGRVDVPLHVFNAWASTEKVPGEVEVTDPEMAVYLGVEVGQPLSDREYIQAAREFHQQRQYKADVAEYARLRPTSTPEQQQAYALRKNPEMAARLAYLGTHDYFPGASNPGQQAYQQGMLGIAQRRLDQGDQALSLRAQEVEQNGRRVRAYVQNLNPNKPLSMKDWQAENVKLLDTKAKVANTIAANQWFYKGDLSAMADARAVVQKADAEIEDWQKLKPAATPAPDTAGKEKAGAAKHGSWGAKFSALKPHWQAWAQKARAMGQDDAWIAKALEGYGVKW